MESLEFRYAYLDRLRADCEYYLNWGGRNLGRLEGSVDEHIKLMLSYYDSFSDDEKPEWLTRSDILKYKERMSGDIDKNARAFLDVVGDIDFLKGVRTRLDKAGWIELVERAKEKMSLLDDDSKRSDYYLIHINTVKRIEKNIFENWGEFINYEI